MKSSVLAGIFAASAAAQGGPWAQCGGLSYSGPTTCVAGWKCVYLNDYFSQCLQDDGSTTQTTVTSVTSTTTSDVETETSACDVETTTTSETSATSTTSDVETTTTSETSATSTTSDVETETSACDAETTTTTLVTVTTSSAPATSTSAAPTKGTFQWFGINESGAEFGQGSYPGTWGQSFIWPSTASLQTHIKDGYNAFRIAFSMERLAPNTLTATLDPGYLKNLTATAEFITEAGGWAILDAHNFGRYYSTVITDTAAFGTFWANVAKAFAGNPRVIFDTNNEFHDMDQTLVFDLNQAAIDGIRGAGANDQYIWVEGNSWSTAFVWNITNDNLAALEDPQDKIIYEVHQYLDADSSGSHDTCASAEIGVQRAVGMTEWLRTNKKLGVLGAFAAGPNDACKTTVTNLLDHLKENNDVWTGALWQAGGPWWSSWAFSFEPPRGTAYINYNALLKEYL